MDFDPRDYGDARDPRDARGRDERDRDFDDDMHSPCINSAHSQFVHGGMGATRRDDDSTFVVHWPAVIGVSGLRACRRDRHADRAPSTP